MDLKQKPNLSLIDLTNYCNSKGYDLFPVRENKGVRCIVFKDDKKIKEGTKVYKNWAECQKESYNKIYQII